MLATLFRPEIRLLVLLLSSTSVHASTLLVGPAGSGAAYTDIQPAIDAALPGDTIVVLPGFYSSFAVSKAVHVTGAGSGYLGATSTIVFGTLEVLGLPPGAGASVGGMTVTTGPIRLTGNQAPVELFHLPNWVTIDHCDRVLITDASLKTLTVASSTVWLAGASLDGGNGPYWGPCSLVPPGGLAPGRPAIDATNAVVYLAETPVRGGTGASCQTLGLTSYGPAGPAVRSVGSVIKHVGGPGSLLAPGANTTLGSTPPTLMLGASSEMLVAPTVQVSSYGAPYEVDSTSYLYLVGNTYPTLDTNDAGAVLGASVKLRATGNPSANHLVFVSAATAPEITIPGIDGAFALDVPQTLLLFSVALGTAGTAERSVALPSSPALLGQQFFLQSLEASAGGLAFGNPLVQSIAP